MGADTESFVQVTNDAIMLEPALSLMVTPRHNVVGTDATMSTTQVCASVNAAELPDDGKRAPIDLVVALDCSGSMNGAKLQLCKTTLERIIRFLLPTDRFGLISFATEAIIEIPARKMTAENKKNAISKIYALHTRGCTNISAAIGLAAQEMKLIGEQNEVRTIFLLTDGLANEGITDAEGMVQLTQNCLGGNEVPIAVALNGPPILTGHDLPNSGNGGVPVSISTNTPITLHCFGYGKDHDSQLLSKLATSATPGGTYYFVENDNNVGEAFGDALGGVLSVVAQSTVVNISVPPEASARGVTILDVHHDQKIQRDDGSYSVTIGDFYAEESRDVLFEIKLATPGEAKELTPVPHVLVSVSYTDTLQKRPASLGPVTCAISRPSGSEISEENKHVVVQWLRIATTNLMATAQAFGRSHDLANARSSIQSAMHTVLNAPCVQADPVVLQLANDLREMDASLATGDFFESGSHVFTSRFQQHRSQRCTNGSTDSVNVYRGTTKSKMAAAFKTS